MMRFLARRFVTTIPSLWLILTMVFLLARRGPGDPVRQLLGDGARAEDVAQLRHALGLDQPVLAQYGSYLSHALRGNLGTSFRFREPVARIVLQRLPATLELALVALLVSAALAIPGGLLAARFSGRPADRAVNLLSLTGLSIPNFALGPLLIVIFAVKLGWLPVSGRGGLTHLVLPAITMGLALAAILMRMVRVVVGQELGSDYVRTARAKGLTEMRVLLRHALPNSLLPILTILGLQFGTLLAGAIVTETIFSWPGIGRLAVQAIEARDYPLLQGCILTTATCYVVVNLLTDMLYAAADPRVRL